MADTQLPPLDEWLKNSPFKTPNVAAPGQYSTNAERLAWKNAAPGRRGVTLNTPKDELIAQQISNMSGEGELRQAQIKNIQSEVEDRKNRLALEKSGQDIQVRGQDISHQQHVDAIKATLGTQMLGHLLSRPDIPLPVVASTMDQLGFPEYGKSLRIEHENVQNQTASKLLTPLLLAQRAGDTKNYNTALDVIKSHPERDDLLPRIMKSIPKDQGQILRDLDPTKPGVQTTPNLKTSPYANDLEFKALDQQMQPQIEAERLAAEERAKQRAFGARAEALQRKRNEVRGLTPGYGRSYEGLK